MVALAAITIPDSAVAQGKSASAPGQTKAGANGTGVGRVQGATASPATAGSAAASSSSSTRALYFGSWLDDASVMEPGAFWAGFSSAYWKAEAARQIDAPVILAAVGVAPWLQLGGSLPIYHYHDQSGVDAHGIGMVSMYGKVVLKNPAGADRFGVAVAPLVEIASGTANRLGWALPVNVEARPGRVRVYGSAGFFSRGSIFGSGALELPVTSRLYLTANLGHASAGSGEGQTDVGIGAALFTSGASSVFVSLGRSLRTPDESAGGVSIGGGFSVLVPAR